MPRFLMVLLCTASACTLPPVEFSATVLDSDARDARALVGADVDIVDPGSERVLASAQTDEQGAILVDVPASSFVALRIDADGYVPTVFHGVIPAAGTLQVPDGDLFAVSQAAFDAVQQRFDGCPGAADGAGIIFGEVRVLDLVDQVSGENLLLSEAQTDLIEVDDGGEVSVLRGGCYLDKAGTAADPTAEFTGESGQFAVVGVPAGLHDLRVRYQAAPGDWRPTLYPAWIPEDADEVALPLLPAWVEFEF